jgi:hypothetical protein
MWTLIKQAWLLIYAIADALVKLDGVIENMRAAFRREDDEEE